MNRQKGIASNPIGKLSQGPNNHIVLQGRVLNAIMSVQANGISDDQGETQTYK